MPWWQVLLWAAASACAGVATAEPTVASVLRTAYVGPFAKDVAPNTLEQATCVASVAELARFVVQRPAAEWDIATFPEPANHREHGIIRALGLLCRLGRAWDRDIEVCNDVMPHVLVDGAPTPPDLTLCPSALDEVESAAMVAGTWAWLVQRVGMSSAWPHHRISLQNTALRRLAPQGLARPSEACRRVAATASWPTDLQPSLLVSLPALTANLTAAGTQTQHRRRYRARVEAHLASACALVGSVGQAAAMSFVNQAHDALELRLKARFPESYDGLLPELKVVAVIPRWSDPEAVSQLMWRAAEGSLLLPRRWGLRGSRAWFMRRRAALGSISPLPSDPVVLQERALPTVGWLLAVSHRARSGEINIAATMALLAADSALDEYAGTGCEELLWERQAALGAGAVQAASRGAWTATKRLLNRFLAPGVLPDVGRSSDTRHVLSLLGDFARDLATGLEGVGAAGMSSGAGGLPAWHLRGLGQLRHALPALQRLLPACTELQVRVSGARAALLGIERRGASEAWWQLAAAQLRVATGLTSALAPCLHVGPTHFKDAISVIGGTDPEFGLRCAAAGVLVDEEAALAPRWPAADDPVATRADLEGSKAAVESFLLAMEEVSSMSLLAARLAADWRLAQHTDDRTRRRLQRVLGISRGDTSGWSWSRKDRTSRKLRSLVGDATPGERPMPGWGISALVKSEDVPINAIDVMSMPFVQPPEMRRVAMARAAMMEARTSWTMTTAVEAALVDPTAPSQFSAAVRARLRSGSQPHPLSVAFICRDFRHHAVGYMTGAIFEQWAPPASPGDAASAWGPLRLRALQQQGSRSRLDRVVAVSLAADDGSMPRRRAEALADPFVGTIARQDADVVHQLRSLDVQVALDMQGASTVNRYGLYTQRVAPVQAAYIALPSTQGMSAIDYNIVDRFVAPPREARSHLERLVMLPRTYQVQHWALHDRLAADDGLVAVLRETDPQRPTGCAHVTGRGGVQREGVWPALLSWEQLAQAADLGLASYHARVDESEPVQATPEEEDKLAPPIFTPPIPDRIQFQRRPSQLVAHPGVVLANAGDRLKLTPESFAVWCNVLRRLPNAVLWLLAPSRSDQHGPHLFASLRAEAAARGVSPHRILAAPRHSRQGHMNRLRNADLYLDTPFGYGSHSTATEMLRVGLPAVAMQPHAAPLWPARVAGALLADLAGPPSTVLPAGSIRGYEANTARLAGTPGMLRSIRRATARRVAWALEEAGLPEGSLEFEPAGSVPVSEWPREGPGKLNGFAVHRPEELRQAAAGVGQCLAAGSRGGHHVPSLFGAAAMVHDLRRSCHQMWEVAAAGLQRRLINASSPGQVRSGRRLWGAHVWERLLGQRELRVAGRLNGTVASPVDLAPKEYPQWMMDPLSKGDLGFWKRQRLGPFTMHIVGTRERWPAKANVGPAGLRPL